MIVEHSWLVKIPSPRNPPPRGGWEAGIYHVRYSNSSNITSHSSSFRYLYTVGLLSSHTRASSLTFSFPATNAG